MTEFSQSVGNPRQIYIFNSRKSGKKGKIQMDAIKAARELGKAIQADERYVRYNEAMKANDADMELQELIGEFNLARQNVALEMSKSKEEQNKEKLDTQNKEMQRLYTLVMQNEHMADFTMAKADMDKLLQEVNGIIALCCDGEDPDTCEVQAGGCSGSCSTCGGCH
jgi:cell fate (sporulation/competence/biofilm development) regulator YlbF (YheA/YmcA/DUF963 family)